MLTLVVVKVYVFANGLSIGDRHELIRRDRLITGARILQIAVFPLSSNWEH
jgi:hypothetical protein